MFCVNRVYICEKFHAHLSHNLFNISMPIVVPTWTMPLSFYCATWKHYASNLRAKISKAMLNQISVSDTCPSFFLQRLRLPRRCFIHKGVQKLRKSHLLNEALTPKNDMFYSLFFHTPWGRMMKKVNVIRHPTRKSAKRGMLNKDSKTLLPLNLIRKSLNGASFILTHNYKNVRLLHVIE